MQHHTEMAQIHHADVASSYVNQGEQQASVSASAEKVHVFISYAHSDAVIAQALYEELVSVNRDRVECFLDTRTIQSGNKFKDDIDKALEKADWLVCIYTGEQSEYCGYEIGVFEKTRGISKGSKDNRLVCLHDVDDLPGLFSAHQNGAIIFPPESSVATVNFDKNTFYLSSPIARFFKDFYRYKRLYVTDDLADSQQQVTKLIYQAERITEAFKVARGEDIEADTPMQLCIELAIRAKRGQELTSVPDEAEISGTFQSMKLFGLKPPMMDKQLPVTTWGRLKAVQTQISGGSRPVWIDCLEKDMVNAANGLDLTGQEVSFPKGGKIWRPILARHRLYKGGSHRFDILFVETLPRQFLGSRTTSALLAAIVMASRFRFAYFEEPETGGPILRSGSSNGDVLIKVRQLLYDIERLEHEAMEFGLDRVSFVRAFGEENRALAESFLDSWQEAKDELLSVVQPALDGMAGVDRQAVGQATDKFLRRVEEENRRFLRVAVDLYRAEMRARLASAEPAEAS